MNIKDFNDVRMQVLNYVNDADLWCLIEMGAPEDEYTNQVDRIVSCIVNKNPKISDLELLMREIFKTNEFELEHQKIRDLAEKISNSMKSFPKGV